MAALDERGSHAAKALRSVSNDPAHDADIRMVANAVAEANAQ
jgi:hypothetical protein